MHLRHRILAGLLVLLAPLALAPRAHALTALSAVRITGGLTRPVFVTSPPGDPRLFIVEQRDADNRGRIRIFKYGAGGGLLSRPFLTTGVLASDNEQGLLGLAFAPDYATSGRFYIDYTDSLGNTHIERHHVSATDPDSANNAGETILFMYQPYTNHNGGWTAFGPDGYLYVAMGDGGLGGDPENRAQNPDSLLGKILRLDVSPVTGYAIPPDNPFVGAIPGRDEVYAYGVRNPFRDSFDRATGDLIIADVGQLHYEEVDFAPTSAGRGKGVNFGWPCYEGLHDYDLARPNVKCDSCQNRPCMQFPAWEYDHTLSRCSITGGYVYRGSAIPDYAGTYFFADYCAARIYTGQFAGGALTNVVERTTELDPVDQNFNVNSISSFGEDRDGELYICDLGGEVFKIVPLSSVGVPPPPPAARAPILALAGAMPFRTTLRLSLNLPVATRVRVAVLDLAGRQVRELLDETLPAGPHVASWDGKDARGADAPPGVYLVRAVTPMGEESLRAVRVR